MCAWCPVTDGHPIQGVFPVQPTVLDGLQIQGNPDQDKVVTEDDNGLNHSLGFYLAEKNSVCHSDRLNIYILNQLPLIQSTCNQLPQNKLFV